uniref:Uncharacterized protein n=1 Tax=Arundo donax TaxID=35708 RepID=A0A0A8ZH57_ARUDO
MQLQTMEAISICKENLEKLNFKENKDCQSAIDIGIENMI